METLIQAVTRKYKFWRLCRRAVWADRMAQMSLSDMHSCRANNAFFQKEAAKLKKQIAMSK